MVAPFPRRIHRLPLIALVVILINACARGRSVPTSAIAPVLRGDQVVLVDRLLFGRSIPGGGYVSDSAWISFLRDVVTPSFPSGFTVWRADGQWIDPRGALVGEPVMIVEVLHPRNELADSVFARVANEYRTRFRQDAVLRTTIDARTRLYEKTPSPEGHSFANASNEP
ncbi:MAG TPA: DUF3574 domain-containing protein [Gemmatimonadaceae bacterium]|nr:DUF3574 domain-containing protein [Gemmatimonadaceae bacterium]